MINISKRLEAVCDFVSDDNITKSLIDVGCDHALVDIYLLKKNQNLKIVASDLNEGPLKKAKENIQKYSLLEKIKLELSDGIEKITQDIDTVIIAGMGMDTIINILKKDRAKLKNVKKMVISSNNKFPLVRYEIVKLGYEITEEKIVFEDGKYYIVMKFLKGKKKYSKKNFFFGPYLLKNKDYLFYNYFKYLKEEKEKILESLPKEYKSKRQQLEKEIKMLINEIDC